MQSTLANRSLPVRLKAAPTLQRTPVEGSVQEEPRLLVIDRRPIESGIDCAAYAEDCLAQLEREARAMQHKKISTESEDAERAWELCEALRDDMDELGDEPLNAGEQERARRINASFVAGMNALRHRQLQHARRKVEIGERELHSLRRRIEAREVALRDKQREHFKASDTSELANVAATLAPLASASEQTTAAIEKSEEVLGYLDGFLELAGAGKLPKKVLDLREAAGKVLKLTEKLDAVFEHFEHLKTVFDLVAGQAHATEAQNDLAETEAVIDVLMALDQFAYKVSMLNGEAVNRCLDHIGTLYKANESTALSAIENGTVEFLESVHWKQLPGGEPMYHFAAALMGAKTPADVPWPPPPMVETYLAEHADSFTAGVAPTRFGPDELPTETHWFEPDELDSGARAWLFKHRVDVWSMLYGSTPHESAVNAERRSLR